MAGVSDSLRNRDILMHIERYCCDIGMAIDQALDEKTFMENRLYQHAVAMCVLEIGELSKHLSGSFQQEHSEIPWRAICRMRDMYAHHYHRTDAHQLWLTATMDIPIIKEFCAELNNNTATGE